MADETPEEMRKRVKDEVKQTPPDELKDRFFEGLESPAMRDMIQSFAERIYVTFTQCVPDVEKPAKITLGPYDSVEISDGEMIVYPGAGPGDEDDPRQGHVVLATLAFSRDGKACWAVHDGMEEAGLLYRVRLHTYVKPSKGDA